MILMRFFIFSGKQNSVKLQKVKKKKLCLYNIIQLDSVSLFFTIIQCICQINDLSTSKITQYIIIIEYTPRHTLTAYSLLKKYILISKKIPKNLSITATSLKNASTIVHYMTRGYRSRFFRDCSLCLPPIPL